MNNNFNRIYLIFLSIILLPFLTSCNDKDGSFGVDDLPDEVLGFTSYYFPHNKIESAKISYENPYYSGRKYALTLSGGIEILYGSHSDYRVSAPNGIPDTATELLLARFVDELAYRNSQAYVIFIQTLNSYDSEKIIKTSDQRRYRTMNNMNSPFLAELVTVEEFPTKAMNFIRNYYPNHIIYEYSLMFVNENGNTYYRFNNPVDYDILFDTDGTFFHAKDHGRSHSILNDIIENEIPQSVRDALTAHIRPYDYLLVISCYENGVYGFKHSSSTLLITEEGKLLSGQDEAEALMKRYYQNEAWILKQYSHDVSSPFRFGYMSQYKSNNKAVTIWLDASHQWERILSTNHINLPNVYLPLALIENELPAAIVAYLKEKGYTKITQIIRHAEGYNIYGEGIMLRFDSNGEAMN